MANISGLGNIGPLNQSSSVEHKPKLDIHFVDLFAGWDTAADVTDNTDSDDSSSLDSLFGGYSSNGNSDPTSDLSSWLNMLEENPALQAPPQA